MLLVKQSNIESHLTGMASLNDCLETGKCSFIDLFMNMIRFRCYRIGISADIEKAFLMVGLKEEDRDLFRFLISKNPDDLDDPEPRRMRFARVTFGAVCSMAMLDNVIRYHLLSVKEQYAVAVLIILLSLYVDDFSAGEYEYEYEYE